MESVEVLFEDLCDSLTKNFIVQIKLSLYSGLVIIIMFVFASPYMYIIVFIG